MIPYLLALAGGYLIGSSRKDEKFADGGGVREKIELYYVQDVNGNVKNISKTYEDADRFWEKSLKFSGDIKVAIVPKEDWEKEKISTANIKRYKFKEGGMMAKGGRANTFLYPSTFYEGQSVLYQMTNNTKLDKSVRDKHNKYANKELVIEKIMDEGGKYKIAKVFVRSSGEKVPFNLVLNPKYLEQYADGGMMAKGGVAKDRVERQRIINSIRQGETILRGKVKGDERDAIIRQVAREKQRLGLGADEKMPYGYMADGGTM